MIGLEALNIWENYLFGIETTRSAYSVKNRIRAIFRLIVGALRKCFSIGFSSLSNQIHLINYACLHIIQ